MSVCEICGKEFDVEQAKDEFCYGVDASFPVDYSNFGRSLCGACAIDEYDGEHYFETCERCGKRFCPQEEEYEFEVRISSTITGADMYEFGLHCADCAEREWLATIEDDE